MKTKISPVLLCLLSVMALVLVCFLVMPSEAVDPHAGHDHASGETHATTQTTQAPTSNVKPSDCFILTENKDGTYSFAVKNYMGGTMYSEKNLAVKPTFTQVNDYVLCVSGMDSKENNLSRWAVYCNIRSMDVSQRYRYVLATVENKVAYLDYMSEKWVVVSYAPLDHSVAMEATELPGLTISETGNPKISYTTTKKGELKVSYTTEDGKKTVVIDLSE